MTKTVALFILLAGFALYCNTANGQTVVQGCGQGSCNPSATGGTAVSNTDSTQTTDVQQPAQNSGGNPITDIIGAVLPAVVGGGRRLKAVSQPHMAVNRRQLRQTVAMVQPPSLLNPFTTGGTAVSNTDSTQPTDVEQPTQDSGGTIMTDTIGTIAPGVVPAEPQWTVQGTGDGRRLKTLSLPAMAVSMRQLRQQQPTIVQGCAQGSCNPTATGGNAGSSSNSAQTTTVKPPEEDDSGNIITDVLGSVFGGRQLKATAAGLRQLSQCVDSAHQAECSAWGPSQCGIPGVNDKCPCMCGGGGAPAGGDTTILVQPVAIGCQGQSCNPSAGGGDAYSDGR